MANIAVRANYVAKFDNPGAITLTRTGFTQRQKYPCYRLAATDKADGT